jgi:DNA-binding transcriptional LysR family regulator
MDRSKATLRRRVTGGLVAAVLLTVFLSFWSWHGARQSDFAPELAHGLVTSKLDLALIAHPGANRKLTMAKIAEAPFYIALPDDHPLAARETRMLEDMHGCTWIIFDSEGSSDSARHFLPRSRGWRHFREHSECADGRRSPPIGFGKCWHRIYNDDERTANQKPRRNRSHFGR